MKPPSPSRSAFVDRVPASTRWTVTGTVVAYTFYAQTTPLTDVLDELLLAEGLPTAAGLVVFGECDYAQGGGAHPWLVLRPTDGSVFSFDLERDAPLSLLNTSVAAFVATFNLFASFLLDGLAVPADLDQALRAIDPEAFDRSEWRGLAAHVRAG